MPSVTIDAGVLAVSRQHDIAGDVDRYIAALVSYGQLLNEPWITVCMSERAPQALINDGSYPVRPQLRRLFAENRVDQYDINTVARIIDRLLQLKPSFEDCYSIYDVLAENVTMDPDILRFCPRRALQSELERCTILIAILRHEHIGDPYLILRRIPGGAIRVRATIQIIEHNREDLDGISIAPRLFDGEVLVCDNINGLIELLDESELMINAANDADVAAAIKIALFKYRSKCGMNPQWNDVPEYRIGGEYRSSVQQRHPTRQIAKKVLRAISETLEQRNMSAVHVLRAGEGRGDSPRVRDCDHAKAWRRDIDRDHHLHYWECDDGLIEIAWLSYPHDDFRIPE